MCGPVTLIVTLYNALEILSHYKLVGQDPGFCQKGIKKKVRLQVLYSSLN